jgi:hypothetical protein
MPFGMTNLQTISALHSTHQFNSDILTTTLLIHQQHPELSKYLEEMSITIPDSDNPVISNQVLMDYAESLRVLLHKYVPAK